MGPERVSFGSADLRFRAAVAREVLRAADTAHNQLSEPAAILTGGCTEVTPIHEAGNKVFDDKEVVECSQLVGTNCGATRRSVFGRKALMEGRRLHEQQARIMLWKASQPARKATQQWAADKRYYAKEDDAEWAAKIVRRAGLQVNPAHVYVGDFKYHWAESQQTDCWQQAVARAERANRSYPEANTFEGFCRRMGCTSFQE